MKAIFLDKNPLFDCARKHLFNETVRKHSLELVERIKNGELEAHIESMAAFALHNYAVHKMSDPRRNIGEFVSKDEAENKVRIFVKYLFKSPSWIFHGMTKEAVMNAINDSRFNFEDACQWQAFKLSGCGLFVTWNIRDFAFNEAITPKDFLERFHIQQQK